MLIEPRDAVRLSLASKAFKYLDNRLWIFYLQCSQEPWDSIFFAETSLRSGYPLRMLSSQSGELSFMRIYGHMAQVPGSIIIDGGSGYCKFGWSKYASPSGICATFMVREFLYWSSNSLFLLIEIISLLRLSCTQDSSWYSRMKLKKLIQELTLTSMADGLEKQQQAQSKTESTSMEGQTSDLGTGDSSDQRTDRRHDTRPGSGAHIVRLAPDSIARE